MTTTPDLNALWVVHQAVASVEPIFLYGEQVRWRINHRDWGHLLRVTRVSGAARETIHGDEVRRTLFDTPVDRINDCDTFPHLVIVVDRRDGS